MLEVKQDFSKAQLEYAREKIASVRGLHRTSAEFLHATGRTRTTPKPILGGILTFESGWSPPLGDAFESALRASLVDSRVDLGCALCDGAFEVVYSDTGEPQVTRSSADSSLIFFFLRLLHRLQQIATVPAIDYVEYSSLLVVGDDEAADAMRHNSAI